MTRFLTFLLIALMPLMANIGPVQVLSAGMVGESDETSDSRRETETEEESETAVPSRRQTLCNRQATPFGMVVGFEYGPRRLQLGVPGRSRPGPGHRLWNGLVAPLMT